MSKPLKWSRKKPTKPGWYWFASANFQPPTVVEVYYYKPWIKKDLAVTSKLGDPIVVDNFSLFCLWAGPIQVPEGGKEK